MSKKKVSKKRKGVKKTHLLSDRAKSVMSKIKTEFDADILHYKTVKLMSKDELDEIAYEAQIAVINKVIKDAKRPKKTNVQISMLNDDLLNLVSSTPTPGVVIHLRDCKWEVHVHRKEQQWENIVRVTNAYKREQKEVRDLLEPYMKGKDVTTGEAFLIIQSGNIKVTLKVPETA